jgi:hypothetical protein
VKRPDGRETHEAQDEYASRAGHHGIRRDPGFRGDLKLFYPLDSLPAGVRDLALANPLTWQLDLLHHHGYRAGSATQLALEGAGLCAFTLASYWLATRSLERPME